MRARYRWAQTCGRLPGPTRYRVAPAPVGNCRVVRRDGEVPALVSGRPPGRPVFACTARRGVGVYLEREKLAYCSGSRSRSESTETTWTIASATMLGWSTSSETW